MSIELILGDCLVEMGRIADGSVDLICADLPYGTTLCRWDTSIPLDDLWRHYRRVIKPNGVVLLTACQPFTSVLVMSNPAWFRHDWVWHKTRGSNFMNTCREPMKEHESVLMFSAGRWTYNRQMQPRSANGVSRQKYPFEGAIQSDHWGRTIAERRTPPCELRVPSSVQTFKGEKGLHPTQKPVTLLEYLVKTYTNPGETVLDNCAGSFSTGVACVNTGRSFIGIEKDETYFRIGQQRIAAAQSQPSLLPAP